MSISGYHIREAGSTAAQELAFTLADGLEYVRGACSVGWISMNSPPGSHSFSTLITTFSRRSPSTALPGVFGPMKGALQGEKPPLLAAALPHADCGLSLTAQQPENNVVRVALRSPGSRPGRDAVLAHQQHGRGAGPAFRGCDRRTAHPAGHRRRIRRGQYHRSPWEDPILSRP